MWLLQKYTGSCYVCMALNPPCMVNALRTCVFKETLAVFICIGQSFQLINNSPKEDVLLTDLRC